MPTLNQWRQIVQDALPEINQLPNVFGEVLRVWAIEGKSVTTVEGLGQRSAPHALQTAFIEEQAMQCGFCTSGILMSAAALLQRQPQPSRQDIVQAIDGHLCRCGAHNRVVRAIEKAAARLATP